MNKKERIVNEEVVDELIGKINKILDNHNVGTALVALGGVIGDILESINDEGIDGRSIISEWLSELSKFVETMDLEETTEGN